MDVRLAAEALARLSLNAPLKTRAQTASRGITQRRPLHLPATPYRQRTTVSRWTQTQGRGLSTTPVRRDAPAGAAAAGQPSPQPAMQPHNQQQSAPVPPSHRAQKMPSDDEIAAVVDQSFQAGQSVARRISRMNSPYSQQMNRESRPSPRSWQSARFPSENANRRRFGPPQEDNKSNNTYMGRRQVNPARSTADMLEEAMGRDPIAGNAPYRSQSSAGLLDSFVTGDPRIDAKEEFNVDDVVDSALGMSTRGAIEKPLPKSSLRLGSSVGRTVQIDPTRGMDLARGLINLDMRLSSNAVRSQYHQQKFHERPGLKRKRLARERWRKQFKNGFRHIVQRVKYLTKMGW